MNRSAELQLRQVRRAEDTLIAPGRRPALQSAVHGPDARANAKGVFPKTFHESGPGRAKQ